MSLASEKLHVFVSYSRDDLDFADQLAAGLRVGSIDPTMDRQGISGGEDWRRRLGSLIRDAETVVFVLSPSSARSETCGWEVEEAARLGKRIVPVVCCPLESAVVPPRLQNLNYVFFYAEPKSPGSGFGCGLEQLVAALNTDIDWLREHTRYLQRATEWDVGGRPENRLLSGADIEAAKAWAARRPKGAPEPTALHLDFIRASENWQAQQQSEERKRLEEMARAQEERARALADREIAQKRETEASRRAEAEARRAAEEASRAASASKTVAKRTAAGLAAALVLAAIAIGVGFYAFNKRQEAVAQSQVAQQELRMTVAWEYTEKDTSVSAALLREVKEPKNIRGWRGATSKTLEMLHSSSKVPLGGTARIRSASFSPDGKRLATASEDGTAKVWDAVNGQELLTLRGHTGFVYGVAYSPDAKFIVTASSDGTARIWDAGSERAVLRHPGPVWAASFSPDGGHVATASEDGKARLWTLNGLLDSVFNVAESGLLSANYSPDGSKLLAVSRDGAADILILLPTIESLEALLWKLSPSCPVAPTRTDLLGQPKAEAERDYQACMVQIEKRGSR